MTGILDKLNGLGDLQSLSCEELSELAEEVRSLIINTVSKTGGHLASNLGVVELTIALLRVFQPPTDKIVWDVSHQTYAYKILTGRKDRFNSLRQFGGISGFSRRDESEYDVFGAGHSGTAISAALGIAVARDRQGGKEHVLAVLGDGAVGCGISLEALNNVNATTKRLIVILNDNEMSIAANVGSVSRYLGNLLANPRYNRWKRSVEGIAARLHMGWLRNIYTRTEEAVKGLFLKSIIFEEFGLRYVGPVDGHDLPALVDALQTARSSDRPILLHVSTQKGKGYAYAEKHPEKWHGTPGFDIVTGKQTADSDAVTYSAVFGETMDRLAARNERIFAITAAMRAGTGLTEFAKKYPDRFFDVGMSEEHAVVFAAGLAVKGMIPIFAVYSTFVQRSIDCIIHDVCLQNLPVVLCLDRAGIVGDDGPTHHGVFDIAMLRPIPGLTIMQPSDAASLADMLYTAIRLGGPVVIRYPRGACPGKLPDKMPEEIEIGRSRVVRPMDKGDSSVSIWALGDMIPTAEAVADALAVEGIKAGIIDARFIKPLDTALLDEQAAIADWIITIENGVVTGGFGAGIREYLAEKKFSCRILNFGWPDKFLVHGSPLELMKEYGLDSRTIVDRIVANCS
ncbi:MAG: 1-deoxy-D-xylulose-5-phosphate synthase [Lentisphaerae bacterium]|nr:1-deoxy-D-xylulose-5-phosphate synthase [Lentisphaerota bacterium]